MTVSWFTKFFTRNNIFSSISIRFLSLVVSLIIIFFAPPTEARVSRTPAAVLPHDGKVKCYIKLGYGPIVTGSDTLYADSVMFNRGEFYQIDYQRGRIDLKFPDSLDYDTLFIHYTSLPSWLKKRYGIAPGRPARDNRSDIRVSSPSPDTDIRQPGSSINLKGAKRFSFLSRTSGGSEFNQSLELTIDGKLSDDLTITGSVSDRGYDPAYGTVNSRINELDKLNLTLQSKRFFAEIGDLQMPSNSDYRNTIKKELSGMQAAYRDASFSAGAALGRPRGRFESVRFRGIDRTQGPYRINTGRITQPIVPGSEQVWVDGILRQRGADKDYIMDYPAATITFMPRLPIDSRSRIEIDFEPLATDYEREYYRAGGGIALGDSLFSISTEYLLEGDDKNRLQSGELSESDLNNLFNAGDDEEGAVRDGAVPDSSGAYIERFDDESIRYFEYVGVGNGDYRVAFSVSENGAYRYDGNDRYSYVGSGNGEYDAVIRIPIPRQERHYNVKMKFRPTRNASFGVKLYGSDYDRNALSTLEDNDNRGGRYQAEASLGAIPSIGETQNGLSFSADLIEERYKSYNRLIEPDISRKYMIPRNLNISTARHEYKLRGGIVLQNRHGLYGAVDYLDYRDRFGSVSGVAAYYPTAANSLFPMVRLTLVDAEQTDSGTLNTGKRHEIDVKWRQKVSGTIRVEAGARFDRRKNHYTGEFQGTTKQVGKIAVGLKNYRISYERYDEDTLAGNWRDRLERDRGTFEVSGKILGVSTDWYLGLQRTSHEGVAERQLLSRLNWSYSNPGARLNLSGHYSLIDENRLQRGVRYIEVESGRGDFILENGEYIPDPNGDYIEVEEILSEQAGIQNGEKSLNLTWRPGGLYFRLVGNSTEELLDSEERNLLWLIPLYSDGRKDYFLRRLYYSGDVRAGRFRDYYFFNLSGTYSFESRKISSVNNERYNWQAKMTLHEAYRAWHFLQNAELFEYKRDQYYNSPGNIDGFRLSGEVSRRTAWGRINGLGGFRRAEDVNGAISRQILAELYPTLRVFAGGESSLRLQGYYQELENAEGVSYRLTDNRSGKLGLIWTLRIDYRVSDAIRLSIYGNGRHSDNRRPRFTGKGEMVAAF